MKVKLLVFPLSVAVSLSVGIWKVQPELDRVTGLRQEISDQQIALDDAVKKVKNADALNGELDAHADLEKMVGDYLPASQDQERMMDALNYLASQSGVALSSAKVWADKESSGTPSAVDVVEAEAGVPPVAVAPKLPKVTVDISLKGEYVNIRDFIQRVSHTAHANEFSSIEIKKASATTPEQQDSNILEASFKVDFSYLSKSKVSDTADPALFAKSNVNFEPAQKLQKYVSSPLPELGLGDTGKANPFTR